MVPCLWIMYIMLRSKYSATHLTFCIYSDPGINAALAEAWLCRLHHHDLLIDFALIKQIYDYNVSDF